MGVTALLAGQQPAPVQLDFIQWIMRLLPLIPLLQLVGVFTSLGLIRRWRADSEHRLSRGRAQDILLPLVPNLALASLLTYLRATGLIQFLDQYMPDLSWIIRRSGSFAGIWAFVRTALLLLTLRKQPPSKQVVGGLSGTV